MACANMPLHRASYAPCRCDHFSDLQQDLHGEGARSRLLERRKAPIGRKGLGGLTPLVRLVSHPILWNAFPYVSKRGRCMRKSSLISAAMGVLRSPQQDPPLARCRAGLAACVMTWLDVLHRRLLSTRVGSLQGPDCHVVHCTSLRASAPDAPGHIRHIQYKEPYQLGMCGCQAGDRRVCCNSIVRKGNPGAHP